MRRPVPRLTLVCIALVASVALTSSGCASSWPSIRLEGDPADLALLVGRWSGSYTSDRPFEPGGSIVFILKEGENTAQGEVLMTRRGAIRPFAPYGPGTPGLAVHRQTQGLPIAFVRTDDGYVSGELESYWDFDRHCDAATTFRGRVRGNVVDGTYKTSYRGYYRADTGRWRVVRISERSR